MVLVVSMAALAMCGASAAPARSELSRVEFGVRGGNMAPFQITIDARGDVRASSTTNFMQPKRHHLSEATISSLSALVRHAFASGVRSRQCAGRNPDVGSDFVRALGRTVVVHGRCEPRFTQLWNALVRAVGLKAA